MAAAAASGASRPSVVVLPPSSIRHGRPQSSAPCRWPCAQRARTRAMSSAEGLPTRASARQKPTCASTLSQESSHARSNAQGRAAHPAPLEPLHVIGPERLAILRRAPVARRIAPEMQEPVPGEIGGSRRSAGEVPVEQRDATRRQGRHIGPADVAVDQRLRQARERREPPLAMLAEVEIEIGVRGAQDIEQDGNVGAKQEDLVEHLRDPAGRLDPPAGRGARIGEHRCVLVERQNGQLHGTRALLPVPPVQAREPVEQQSERAFVEAAPRGDSGRHVIHQHPALAALAMKGNVDGRARERRRQALRQTAGPQRRLVERGAEECDAPGLRHELLEHEGAGIGLEREDIGRDLPPSSRATSRRATRAGRPARPSARDR